MTGPNFEPPGRRDETADQKDWKPVWAGPDRAGNVVRSPVAENLAPQAARPEPTLRECPTCAGPLAGAMVCPHCGQVMGMAVGVHVSSRARRLGGFLLGAALFVVTLGVGYVVWSLIVWRDGTTPAKKLLHMTVVSTETGQPATWECLVIREGVAKFLLCGMVIGSLLPGIGFALCALPIFGGARQTVWDKMTTTLVVDDPAGRPIA